MNQQFSKRGEQPTKFELDVIANPHPSVKGLVWLTLAQKIGLPALFAVLDEIGGGDAVKVPDRDDLMRRIWRPTRNAEIERLAADGHSKSDIAKAFCLSWDQVSNILRNAESRGLSSVLTDRSIKR